MWTSYSVVLLLGLQVLVQGEPGQPKPKDVVKTETKNGTDFVIGIDLSFSGLVEPKEADKKEGKVELKEVDKKEGNIELKEVDEGTVESKEGDKKEETASKGSPPGDCGEYCSLSYPPHTYPQPLHLQACKCGCRSAQLDALIAWPAKPQGNLCKKGCEEAYSDDQQRYACLTGCKAPSWDTMFPDRGHVYQNQLSGQEGSEVASIMGQMVAALASQADFFSPREFDQLQDHAVDMELVIVPYRQFDITILTDEEVYSVHQYNMDSKDHGRQGSNPMSSDSSWLTYHESHHECLWFRHRLMVSRLLLFLSIVLAVLGVCMCCSSFSSSKKTDNKEQVKISAPVQNVPVLYKKAPYDVGTEFLIPIPPDTHKNEKISVI